MTCPGSVRSVVALPDDLAPVVPFDAANKTESPVVVRRRSRFAVYLALTKPRVIELLLVTTVPAMILADEGLPPLALIAAVLLGGTMAAGGANTINCWIERDRDQFMRRTHNRPLPQGDVSPVAALIFGLVLEMIAFIWLWATVNLLSAMLAVGAMLFYVFVYTIWLKPRTVQNIVIGGAAGAVPVLVGWSSVTGSLALPAWIMFAIVFLWTPPHFWAIAIRYRDDYAAAGFPMLPVVKGVPAATRQIVAYSVIVTATSLLLGPTTNLSWGYTAAALVLGIAFIVEAIRLNRDPSEQRAINLFKFSNMYLALLFAAIAIDSIVQSF